MSQLAPALVHSPTKDRALNSVLSNTHTKEAHMPYETVNQSVAKVHVALPVAPRSTRTDALAEIAVLVNQRYLNVEPVAIEYEDGSVVALDDDDHINEDVNDPFSIWVNRLSNGRISFQHCTSRGAFSCDPTSTGAMLSSIIEAVNSHAGTGTWALVNLETGRTVS
jgi:hypothetical protein